MSAGTADPESVRTSITSMNALLDPLKHLYLNLADADGKTTRARCLFALADTGILDDLPCADVSADLGRGFCDDAEVEWTYEDFVNVLGAAIAHRTAHRKPLPSAPRGVPQRQLRDLFHLCCNDFDRARPKSNASRLTLHQWRVMCDDADLLTRRFTADASAVVFARCRKGPERDLGLDQFIACLAAAAAETGRTFESVVSAVSTSPLMTGGAENVPPAKEIGPAATKDTYKTPGKVRVPTVFGGAKPKTPGASLKTPGASLKTPGGAMKTPGASLKTPAAGLAAEAQYTSALEAAVGSPDPETFTQHDTDGDGLLHRTELVTLLSSGDSASMDGALELVTKLFDDVDLDRDGRVCLAEYEAFCKKAQRTLRRRTMSSAHGPTAAAPVPPVYVNDVQLEEMFVAYCVVGAAKTPAKDRPNSAGDASKPPAIDERRFLRALKDAKLLGPNFVQQQAQLCFHSACAKNERKLEYRGFLKALGAVVAHAGLGVTFDSVATAVKSLPIPDKLSQPVIEPTVAPMPAAKTPGARPFSARASIGSFGTSSSSGDSSFGSNRGGSGKTPGFGFKSAKPRPKSAKPRVSVSFADDDDVGGSDAKSVKKPAPPPAAKTPDGDDAPPALLAAFDRREAEAHPEAKTGSIPYHLAQLALADVAGLNGADAAAVGAAFRETFEGFAVKSRLRREKLGEFVRKFNLRVAAAAAAGATLVPPVEVPTMSQPQSDAISGVFDSTVGDSISAPEFMTREEFTALLASARLCGQGDDAEDQAAQITFCRCVSGKPRGEMDFAAFVTALAAIAGERELTFFQVAAPVVDAAMKARAERELKKKGAEGVAERDTAAPDSVADAEPTEPEPEPTKPEEPEEPMKPEEVEEPMKPETPEEPTKPEEPTPVAAPPLTADERAVWAQEFKSHDVALAGVIDRERVSFALAKLRLLEDVDISLAADDLEASVGIVDPNRLNEFDFDAFVAIGSKMRALKLGGCAGSAKPVPVQREYVFDEHHVFAAKFRGIADANGEIDGDSYAKLLEVAGLCGGGVALSLGGAGVVFARARARHPGSGRRVPYRIFLGALSLSAGHLGLSFAEVVERIMATEL